MEDTIQFVAKHGRWVVVKKTRPNENTPLDNALFLASVLSSLYDGIERYLREALDLSELDKTVEETVKSRRASKDSLCEVISSVKGPKVGRVINSVVEDLHGLQKKEKEAVKSLLKAYALRKALLSLNLKVDYTVAAEEMKRGLSKFKGGR